MNDDTQVTLANGNAIAATKLLQSVVEMLTADRLEVGAETIFGPATAESIAEETALVRGRAADILDRVSAALRAA